MVRATEIEPAKSHELSLARTVPSSNQYENRQTHPENDMKRSKKERFARLLSRSHIQPYRGLVGEAGMLTLACEIYSVYWQPLNRLDDLYSVLHRYEGKVISTIEPPL
jgi:hypothetical protein